jgi:hypothetical protein
VDNTARGILAKRLQDVEKRLGGVTSYRVRIAEQAGMALATLLPSTNPWGPGDCGREDCIICKQQDEKQQDCRRRNVLYENQCQVCKVDMKDGENMNDFLKDGKGRYIGETSRSKFKFSLIASFQDPLSRQLAESVRIERGGDQILNSRSEYSRCRVPRLRIILEDWKTTTGKVKTINASGSSRNVCINVQTSSSSNIVSEEILKDDENEAEMISSLEKEARRKDSKRKQDSQDQVQG